MNPTQIQENLEELIKNYSTDEFIYDLLRSYGLAKASITRLKKGEYNLSDNGDEVIWKNKLYYKEAESEKLYDVIDELSTNKKVRSHDLRFIIVTDHERLLAEDTKTKEKRDIAIDDLPKHFDFFLPWAGMEKRQHINENPADVKAAEKLATLFDEIKKNNATKTDEEVHSLNVFLSRLLFCFFAEDTGIFEENLFTNSVSSHTKEDGSDLHTYFEKLFAVFNEEEREETPAYLNQFPYVNGGLFADHYPSPEFSRKSRQILIECGELDWKDINPDIFGSMMQAVITPDKREGLGMHYTSVPNIMKVIEPLFLNDLYDAFEKNKFKPKKLHNLLDRISKFKIFDPACGSGNFLVIGYKQLRYFEIKVLKQLQKLQEATHSLDSPQKELIPKSQLSLASSHQLPLFSRIQLSQFYGIEIDDFAHEVAQLSLWLAEHQMNATFYEEFGQSEPTLPLKDAGNIVQGNATRLDWEKICDLKEDKTIFLLGNPPYTGYSRQSKSQKKDMSDVLGSLKDYKKLDYIACWFYKAAQYIQQGNSKYAFVTTNSLAQGEQVAILWPGIFELGLEISFAYKSFKWQNNAKGNANVYVTIIGVDQKSDGAKTLFDKGISRKVENINPYLVPSSNILVSARRKPLSNLPKMIKGCSPGDKGNLLLNENEKKELITENLQVKKFLKYYIGAREFMYDKNRYCIWINEDSKDEAYTIPELAARFEKVKKFRQKSSKKATRKKAKNPHYFLERKYSNKNSILIPQTGSKRRKYLPIGFLDANYVISNAARVIYDAEPWLFGMLSSKMHIAWVKMVAGRLKTDMQYSNTLCYNTFPFPSINESQQKIINEGVMGIIEAREMHSEKTMADLYDPDKMPEELLSAHKKNDKIIEICYREQDFKNDEERLEVLFELYEKMIKDEKN